MHEVTVVQSFKKPWLHQNGQIIFVELLAFN